MTTAELLAVSGSSRDTLYEWGARSGREWQELYSMVNRVVLVIPIPCLGDEYRPPVSDLLPTKEVAG